MVGPTDSEGGLDELLKPEIQLEKVDPDWSYCTAFI